MYYFDVVIALQFVAITKSHRRIFTNSTHSTSVSLSIESPYNIFTDLFLFSFERELREFSQSVNELTTRKALA